LDNIFFKIFSILFFSLFFSSFTFACLEWQDYYVHDDGYTSDCRGFTHYTISEALVNDSVCARIYVCEGSYNEDITIPNNSSVQIIGKGVVNIVGKTKGIYALGGNVVLDNLNIINTKNIGIYGANLDNLELKNIIINNISDAAAGIGISSVKDLTLENILIDNVKGNVPKGINIYDSTVTSNNVDIKNVLGKNDTFGLSLIDSNLNANDLLIYMIGTEANLYPAKGLVSKNSDLILNDFEIARVYGSSSFGIVLENTSLKSDLLKIGYVVADKKRAIALNAIDNSVVNIDKLETLRTKTNVEDSFELFFVNSEFKSKEVLFNDTQLKATGIFGLESKFNISKLNVNSIKSDYKFFVSNDSELLLSNINLDAKADVCFDLKDNSKLNLTYSDLKDKCNSKSINASNSSAYVVDTPLDTEKTFVDGSGVIDMSFIVSFPFRDLDNKSVKANALYLESKSDYMFKDYYEKFDTINVTYILRYMYKHVEDGLVKKNIFDNYLSVLYKNGYVPKIYEFDLENARNQEYVLTIGNKMSDEIKELKIISNTTESYKSFFVEKKNCSKVLDKTYGCFSIGLPYGMLFESNKDYELYFSLPNDWLTTNNLTTDDITLYRYKDGNYLELNTEYKNNLFVSDLMSSTEYLIGVKQEKISEKPPITTDPVVTPKEEPKDPKNPTNPSSPITNPDSNLPIDSNIPDVNLPNNEDNVLTDSNYVRGSNCLIKSCPDDMILDLENCVCKPISNSNYIPYVILGVFGLLLITGIVLLSILIVKLNVKKKLKKSKDFSPVKKRKPL
jgi:PGF-pre-PGF domain-containing protein